MRRILPSLTSLRFFAAAAIFALHAEQIAGFPKGQFAGFTLNQGVSFFYVLSGFILHYNYRGKTHESSWVSFFALRFFRLWPLHLLGLALASALAWSDIVSWYNEYLSIPKLLSIVFMLHAWNPDNHVYFAINGVSWSLSVEIFFYACFPALSRMVHKNPMRVFAAVSAIVLAFTFVAQGMHVDISNGIYNINPLVRLPEFVVGILAAEWRARRPTSGVARATGTVYETASLGVLALSNWFAPPVFGWAFENLGIGLGVYAHELYLAVPCAAVIYVFSRERGAISAIMDRRLLVLLGEASFALYVIHQPIQKFMAERLIDMPPVALAATCALLTITLAVFLHRLVELPAYRFSRRLIDAGPTKRPGRDHSAGRGTSAFTESGRES
ncbi:acyltransferase family protein [Burkholderia vietnamiensis]|uniref:acyltransferase family protein n=1 Tax=Burkholderia vietnamiensis TaxID=60552 RepID=UPI0026543115|nr:acyltransferase [Burkholderia vietnamiensis]MDN8067266.1 acyltransferase [Burkholderia vietnamiensis]